MNTVIRCRNAATSRGMNRPLAPFCRESHSGENPFSREARVVGASTIDPKKASLIGGKIDQNTLVFSHPSRWSRSAFSEANGQIKARREYRYETRSMGGSGGIHALVKMGEVSRAAELMNDSPRSRTSIPESEAAECVLLIRRAQTLEFPQVAQRLQALGALMAHQAAPGLVAAGLMSWPKQTPRDV